MASMWKEPYELEQAKAIGIHSNEDIQLVGRADAQWIYYVRVCSFTFAFFSLEMLEGYLTYYSRKILPSSAVQAVGWMMGEPQTQFDRLPLYLREEPKRVKVVKALTAARDLFRNQDR